MKFRPLHDRVVVRRVNADEKTAGGIIIPDTAKEKPSQGEVVAVGPGSRDEKGQIVDGNIRCPLHGYEFDLKTGQGVGNGDMLETIGVIESDTSPEDE